MEDKPTPTKYVRQRTVDRQDKEVRVHQKLVAVGVGLLLAPIIILCAVFGFAQLEYSAILGTPLGSISAMVFLSVTIFATFFLSLTAGARSALALGTVAILCSLFTIANFGVKLFTSHSGLIEATSAVTGWSTFLPGLSGLFLGAWFAAWRGREVGYRSQQRFLRSFDRAKEAAAHQEPAVELSVGDPFTSKKRTRLEIMMSVIPSLFFALLIAIMAFWQSLGVLVAGPMPPVKTSHSSLALFLVGLMSLVACFVWIAIGIKCPFAAVISATLIMVIPAIAHTFFAIMTSRMVVPGDAWAISSGLAAPLMTMWGLFAIVLSFGIYWARSEGITRAAEEWLEANS